MQKPKVHILDYSSHRQALYVHYLEQAGYVVEALDKRKGKPVLSVDSFCLVASLPDNHIERAGVIKMLSGMGSLKPLFVLDSVGFSHQDFLGMELVGHINRRTLSLLQTLTELTNSLNNFLK